MIKIFKLTSVAILLISFCCAQELLSDVPRKINLGSVAQEVLSTPGVQTSIRSVAQDALSSQVAKSSLGSLAQDLLPLSARSTTLGSAAKRSSLIPSVAINKEDQDFIMDAYNKYKEQLKIDWNFTGIVKRLWRSMWRTDLIEYCNALLSRFDRSQLGIIYTQSVRQKKDELKKALEVGVVGIDDISQSFLGALKQEDGLEQSVIADLSSAKNKVGIYLNATNRLHQTALMLACKNGYTEAVQEIMGLSFPDDESFKVNINGVDNDDMTALMYACSKEDSYSVVETLLSFKKRGTNDPVININYVNPKGVSALSLACDNDLKVARLLLECGASIVVRDPKSPEDVTMLDRLRARLEFADRNILKRFADRVGGRQDTFNALSKEDEKILRWILSVFDAVKPEPTQEDEDDELSGVQLPKVVATASTQALGLLDAYYAMQRGNGREILAMLAGAYNPTTAKLFASVHQNLKAMQEVFKLNSIEPIVKFLQVRFAGQQGVGALGQYTTILKTPQSTMGMDDMLRQNKRSKPEVAPDQKKRQLSKPTPPSMAEVDQLS